MRTVTLLVIGALAAAVVLLTVVIGYVRRTGLDAHASPSAGEARLARAFKRFAIPRQVRERSNPLSASPELLAEGRAHFADHCASCHGNDGSGDTTMGRGLSPRAPDMRLPATQDLSDGELFWIIENGVRFTGMPAWGNGTPASEKSTWQLVHFVRHLPRLTSEEMEEMEGLNPRSPEEIRQEIEEEKFLKGESR